MLKYLQSIGKSLLLPVAVLPAAAILMGIGYWIDPTGWGANNVVAAFLIKAGGGIIDNLPILFAVGLAFGMAKNRDGAAAIAGLVGFLTVKTLLSPGSVAQLFGRELSTMENLAFGKIDNAFIGIVIGLIAAALYNKFHKTELPDYLAFFSGRRCVPIVTSTVMLIVSALLLVIWPPIYSGLVSFGEALVDLGPLGAGIFGFANRLLIPVGLHHALNAVFWFDIAGINDLNNFWSANSGEIGKTGMYMAGFFPVMMFGLPGACLAMYHTAKTKNKKRVYGLLLAGAVAAFFTGVTEPIEFSFMFVAPILYLVHAILTGVSMFITASMQWFAGFGFSAGMIDLILSIKVKYATKWYMLPVLGVVYFGIYYAIFRVLITKLNLKTPGREEEEILDDEALSNASDKLENKWNAMAFGILNAIGGKENVVTLDNCATRLRMTVKNSEIIDEAAIKKAGGVGFIRSSKETIQVIIGPKVQFVADEMQEMLK